MSATARAARCPTSFMTYRVILDHQFVGFNSARVLAYVLTVWVVASSGGSCQHTLWTWLIFLGGNATLFPPWEQNGRRVKRAIATSAANAVMCTGVARDIAWTRL